LIRPVPARSKNVAGQIVSPVLSGSMTTVAPSLPPSSGSRSGVGSAFTFT
jgi:hypothetical protein